MQRIKESDFGEGKLLFGSDECKSGIDLVKWVIRINTKISDQCAAKFLKKNFIAEDVTQLKVKMVEINSEYDEWMSFISSPQGNDWLVACGNATSTVPPTPSPAPGVKFVSKERLDYGKSLSFRIKTAQTSIKEAEDAC